MAKKSTQKIIFASNKKAFFDYELIDKFDAGIKLIGAEVKAIKNHRISLKGSFITIHKNELFAENIHISPYQPKNQPDYNPTRRRKLILERKEIDQIIKALDSKGLAVIPLEVYPNANLIKVLIGIGQGRKKYDKREVLKKRSQNLEIQKALKRFS